MCDDLNDWGSFLCPDYQRACQRTYHHSKSAKVGHVFARRKECLGASSHPRNGDCDLMRPTKMGITIESLVGPWRTILQNTVHSGWLLGILLQLVCQTTPLVKSTFLRQMVPKIILKSSQIIPKSSHLHPNHPNHPKPIQHSINVPTFFPLFARKPRPPTSTVRRRARRGDHCASLRARETNLWPSVHHVLGWKICGSVGNLWGFCKDLIWFNGIWQTRCTAYISPWVKVMFWGCPCRAEIIAIPWVFSVSSECPQKLVFSLLQNASKLLRSSPNFGQLPQKSLCGQVAQVLSPSPRVDLVCEKGLRDFVDFSSTSLWVGNASGPSRCNPHTAYPPASTLFFVDAARAADGWFL